jgi:hypothetical protein
MAVVGVVRLLMAVVFARAALSKGRNGTPFRLAAVSLVPAAMVTPLRWAIVLSELAAAALLTTDALAAIGGGVALGLLTA